MARSHKPHAAITAIEVQSLARQARDRYALVVVDEDGGDDIEVGDHFFESSESYFYLDSGDSGVWFVGTCHAGEDSTAGHRGATIRGVRKRDRS